MRVVIIITMSIAIRITAPYVDLIPFFAKLRNYGCRRYVAYQHDQSETVSRTHVHLLIWGSYPSTPTMKGWILASLNKLEMKKSDWSFKSKGVTEDFITYMSKGVLDPVEYGDMYTRDELDRYKQKWVDYTEDPKREATTAYQMSQELAQYIQSRYAHLESVKELYEACYYDVVDKAIEIHNRHRKSFCEFSLLRVIQTAFGMGQTPFRQQMATKVYRKLYSYDI